MRKLQHNIPICLVYCMWKKLEVSCVFPNEILISTLFSRLPHIKEEGITSGSSLKPIILCSYIIAVQYYYNI